VQSGLLIVPQAAAAMSSKVLLPRVLARFGYRRSLISNTLALGVALLLFGLIDARTPVWAIVALAFCYGALTSLQYTSMNTLVYADIGDAQASAASSIASTMQQMSISFGVAAAGLTTALFIPDRFRTIPAEIIHGVHWALWLLGGFTVLSTLIFRRLKAGDGGSVSLHKLEHSG
jgi:MFS family permease